MADWGETANPATWASLGTCAGGQAGPHAATMGLTKPTAAARGGPATVTTGRAGLAWGSSHPFASLASLALRKWRHSEEWRAVSTPSLAE